MAATQTLVVVRWNSGSDSAWKVGAFSVAERDDFQRAMFPDPVTEDTVDYGSRADLAGFRLGQVDPGIPVHPFKVDSLAVRIVQGPNRGLSFLIGVPMQPPEVSLNRTMFTPGSRWYDDQNGIAGSDTLLPVRSDPVSGRRYCTVDDIPAIIREVRLHEGKPIAGNANVPGNSHPAIWNAALGVAWRDFESFVFRTGTDMGEVWQQLNAKVIAVLNGTGNDQVLFEARWWEKHAEATVVGCAIDMNPRDQ
jgi:hypothetical protein